jgi:hypothetical protein
MNLGRWFRGTELKFSGTAGSVQSCILHYLTILLEVKTRQLVATRIRSMVLSTTVENK